MLHEHFQSSPARTEDPDQAQLFMIPVYLGRYYNWFWQQWSTPGMPLVPLPSETYRSLQSHIAKCIKLLPLPVWLGSYAWPKAEHWHCICACMPDFPAGRWGCI